MQAVLRSKFTVWTALFVLVPALVLALAGVVSLVRGMSADAAREAGRAAESAFAHLDQTIRTEAVRIRMLADMPGASSLISLNQRRDVADEPVERKEQAWEKAGRDDLMVRSVLDNDQAQTFTRVRGQQPQFGLMLLTDTRGQTLAATEKTIFYGQESEIWWKHGRAAAPTAVSAEAITPAGLAVMMAGVLRAGSTNTAEGLIRVDVQLDRALQQRPLKTDPDALLFVVAPAGLWPANGPADKAAAAHSQIKRPLAARQTRGYVNGYRYAASPLDGGVLWREPMTVVFARKQSALSGAMLGVVAGGGLVAVLLAGGLFYVARLLGLRRFIEPLVEAAEAGLWALRAAKGPGLDLAALRMPWAQQLTEQTSKVQRNLGKWLVAWREELLGQSANLNAEMKRDLDLASEFQQAFLNRPYPRIPEVHMEGRLRLVFAHEYRPATVMGGDFFEISPLAPDCAGIFVADVMGHGMRSALIVSILRTLIAELSQRGRNAPHFIRELNTEFCSLLKTLPHPFFASAAYFVADTTSRMATYAFAGHPPPFVLHRSTGRVSRLNMPRPQGAAMGLIPSEEYGGDHVRLNPGDGFIFFTDGAYEAANRQGEEFGIARMEKVIRANVYRPSKEVLAAVIKAIQEFAGEESIADDICLVAVDVTTDPEPK